jgi:hypothetical protein
MSRQGVLGQPLSEVARRGPAAGCSCRAELLLDLATVGQAVLHIPDRTARPLDTKHMAARRVQHAAHQPRMLRLSRDISGTSSVRRRTPRKTKPRESGAFLARPERFELPTFGSVARYRPYEWRSYRRLDDTNASKHGHSEPEGCPGRLPGRQLPDSCPDADGGCTVGARGSRCRLPTQPPDRSCEPGPRARFGMPSGHGTGPR